MAISQLTAMAIIQPAPQHPPTVTSLGYDQVAQLLFVTASYIVAGAVRAGRASRLIARMAGLSSR